MSREQLQLRVLELLATLDGPEWGRRVKAAREAKRLTQLAAAAKAGVHPITYGDVERGRYKPTPETLWRIASGLKLDPAILFAPIDPERSRARPLPDEAGADAHPDPV